MDGIVDSITQFQTETKFGGYANYADAKLTKQQAWELYYGAAHIERLNTIKDLVDPDRVFWNPQAIRA